MLENTQLIASYGFILNTKKELLIVKRAAHDSHPNIWEMPGGGIDFGEHPQDAAVREVKEEAGLTVLAKHPLTIHSGYSSRGKHIQTIRIAYLCVLDGDQQEVKLSSEHSESRWVSLPIDPTLQTSDLLNQAVKTITLNPTLLNF